jgi:prevent-host-death family protein
VYVKNFDKKEPAPSWQGQGSMGSGLQSEVWSDLAPFVANRQNPTQLLSLCRPAHNITQRTWGQVLNLKFGQMLLLARASDKTPSCPCFRQAILGHLIWPDRFSITALVGMQINILDAKNQLSQPVKRAQAGEEVIIAKRGQPVARQVPGRQGHATASAQAGLSGIAQDRQAWD